MSERARYDKQCKACSNARLHVTGIVLGLGHPDVKASLLISCSGCCNCSIGLLVGAVDSQLIKRDLRLETMSVQLKIISGVQ